MAAKNNNPAAAIKPKIYTPKTELLDAELDEIAFQLAYNYFTNSFSGDKVKNKLIKKASKKVFDKEANISEKVNETLKENIRVRNILIVGAGASYDSYHSMPKGEDLTEEMDFLYKKKIETKKLEFLNNKYKTEENEIKITTGNEKLNFENYLSLLNKLLVNQGDLREKIKEMTGLRYAPSLFNEIAAHLLKHSFIDIVINYNFEETLDQAIEDEIGKMNYHEVISDGHCVNLNDITNGGRLTTPLYIKPHGTNSHKSTLRFTNNHYFELPIDIRAMLHQLLACPVKKGKGAKIEQINLFVVGFALESFELNEILKDCLEGDEVTKYTIYHIDYSPVSYNKEKFKLFLKNIGIKIEKDGTFKSSRFTYIPVKTSTAERTYSKDSITSPLSEFFSVIWRKTHALFAEDFLPRSIAKHEIMFYLMTDDLLKDESKDVIERRSKRNMLKLRYEDFKSPDTLDYFLDRALIEVALAFTRNRGIVDLIELLKGKAGKYHALYLKAFKACNKKTPSAPVSLYDLVAVFAPQIEIPPVFLENTDNIYKIAERFYTENNIASVINSSKKEFTTPGFLSALKDAVISEKDLSVPEQLSIYVLAQLICCKYLSKKTKRNLEQKFNRPIYNGFSKENTEKGYECKNTLLKEIFRLFTKSARSHYYIINPREKDTVHNMFESFNPENILHTNLSFTLKFTELLEADWDIALIVTERAGVMKLVEKINNQSPEHFSNKHIVLICSYEAREAIVNGSKKNEWYKKVKDKIRNEIPDKNLTLLFVPSREHNHHMALFLKNGVKSKKDKLTDTTLELANDFNFLITDAIYHFRQSFSNSVDPIIIKTNRKNGKVKNDFGKLLKLFHLLLVRSFDFMGKTLPESDMSKVILNNSIADYYSTFIPNDETKTKHYKGWSTEEYNAGVIALLKFLYKFINTPDNNIAEREK